MPNHRIASGIHAIGEIGRKDCTSGFNASKARVDHPIHRPSGTPTRHARPNPAATRYTLATVYRTIVPSRNICSMATAVSYGVGNTGMRLIVPSGKRRSYSIQ